MHRAGQRGSRIVIVEQVEPRRLFAFEPLGQPDIPSSFGTTNVDALAGTADGTHVTAWIESGTAFIAVFNGAGVQTTPRLLVNTSGTATSVDVALNASGNIVVTYAGTEPGGINSLTGAQRPPTVGVYVRQFDIDGTPADVAQLVNTIPDGDQINPRVGVAADGSFVVVFHDDFDSNIKYRRFAADGTAIESSAPTVGTGVTPDITVRDDGSYVIAYTTTGNTFAQRYTASGVIQGATITVAANGNSFPSIGGATDGSFVVAWQRPESTGSRYDVVFQRYSAGGAAVGGITDASSDNAGDERYAQVDVGGGGQFIIGWAESSFGTVFNQLGFRAFDNTAAEVTDETIIDDADFGTTTRFGIIYRDANPVRVAYLSNASAYVQTYILPAILEFNLGDSGNNLFAVGNGTTITVVLNGVTTTHNAIDYTRIEVNGGDGDDIIVFYNVDQNIFVFGGAGNDQIRTSNGNDYVDAGDGDDAVALGAGDDYVYGGAGNDSLFGGDGDDGITGGPGRNLLYGEDGNDLLQGGNRPDTIFCGAGDDRAYGYGHGDAIYGQEGADTLFGGAGNDGLVGGPGNDVLDGEDGDDTLRGSAGSDHLIGRNGNDVLFGDPGSDALDGGLGFDTGHYDALDTLFSIERRRLQR